MTLLEKRENTSLANFGDMIDVWTCLDPFHLMFI